MTGALVATALAIAPLELGHALLQLGNALLQLGPAPLQLGQTVGSLGTALAQVAGLTVIVGAIAAGVAFAYRWFVRERVPAGLPVLVGLTLVAASVGTTRWLSEVIAGSDQLFTATATLANIGVFVVAGFGAYAGVHVGDRLAGTLATDHAGRVDREVSRLVETVGRVTTVELPEDVEDVVGYDPVSPSTKDALAGASFVFPRRITVAELRERLVGRLKTDYGVGHVDLELADDGTVEYLALGSRAAGIGPTLPPETAAVAIRADPAFAASAGDLVKVWETDPTRRVLTAELRGVADDVVTLAVDAADTPKLDPDRRYKLLTLPVEDRPDREFASLLRAADETLGSITVGADSDLVGLPVGAVEASVVAITGGEDGTVTLPHRDHTLRAGDECFVIATPEALRKLETAAAGHGSAPTNDGDRPDEPRG